MGVLKTIPHPRLRLDLFKLTMLGGATSRLASTSRTGLIASSSTLTAKKSVQSSSRSRSLSSLSPTSYTATSRPGLRWTTTKLQATRQRITSFRAFSQTQTVKAASLSNSHPAGEPAVLLHYPTLESIRARESELKQGEDEDDDIDIELVPLEEATLEVTDRAAEVRPAFLLRYWLFEGL